MTESLTRNKPVLITSTVETILLIGTFLAGTTTLLNDVFPLNQTWMAALLSSHLSLAILSGLGAVLLFALTYLSDRKDLFYMGLATVLAVALAAAGGLAFYSTYNYDFSYLMALSFIVAIIPASGCIALSL